ncbi:hypothetical protein HU735_16630 [Pseudomonas sp. BW16M2]|uniref:hypothetical protein n=1 Tax=Pseudomonas sp. BW16M2 TaxID=2745489 RepID=UPI0016474FDC|nr:hypothetical protein [Pseudomonas sp. BW16M2]MBC3437045.1 hypothetical protein [Pseudomonas sp. BW16M2]
MVYRNTFFASGIFQAAQNTMNGTVPEFTGLAAVNGVRREGAEQISYAEKARGSVVKKLEYHNMVRS